ncbi:MAG: DUF4012 domain-containing protein [Actinomycetota bacterium]
MADLTRLRRRLQVRRHRARRRPRVRRFLGRLRRRRRRPLVIGGIIVAVLLLGGLAVLPALQLRDSLVQGRRAVLEGRRALFASDVESADRWFRTAESAFLRASNEVGNPILRAVGLLPVLGSNRDAVAAIASAGMKAAQVGLIVTEEISEIPGGIGALGPSGGTIPIEPILRLADPVERARALALEANRTVAEAPRSFLLGPIADARNALAQQLELVLRAATAGEQLLRMMPDFLGAGVVKRYFLGAQNPAELRGTGGLIGAYTILTAQNGRITIGDFNPVQALPDALPSAVPAPNPDYAARYNAFGGAGFWQNINMTPDFPSAAVAIERLYERVRGERLDGTIVADPFALAELLSVTGSVAIPEVETRVNSQTVVPYVANEAYADLPSPTIRKRLLGDVAQAAVDEFLDLQGNQVRSLRAVIGAAAGGHLLLHAANEEVQQAFETTGIAGTFAESAGDFLAVAANNAGGNKVDFYTKRSIRYEVQLGARGSALGKATVTLTNRAPLRGPPRYVIGPFPGASHAGENVTYLSTYCARSCQLTNFHRGEDAEAVGSELELGHPVHPVRVRLPPRGGSQTLTYDWSIVDAWNGNEGRGVYRLTYRSQPTIKPTDVEIDIRVPEGMRVVSASPGVQTSGGRAIWLGTTDRDLVIEVGFARPFVDRAWRAVVRFFNKPLFSIGG